MKSIFSCKKKRESVERAAFAMANQLSIDGTSVKAWETATTEDGVCFLKPVVDVDTPTSITVKSPLNSKSYQVSIEAFGIVITLYLQNVLERDSRFRDFSNDFQNLYKSVLSHPEMEPILAVVS